MAAGSSTSLERSDEQDCNTEHRWHEDKGYDKNCERSRECKEDHTHQKGKSSHCEHASGHDHGGVSKHGRSAEPGSSSGHPHSKEQ